MNRFDGAAGRARQAWRGLRARLQAANDETADAASRDNPSRAPAGTAALRESAHGPDPGDGARGPLAVDIAEPPLAPRADQASLTRQDDATVARSVRIAAAWSWRLLVIGVAVGALLWLLSYVSMVVVPLVVALLLAALLEPAAARLREVGVPRSLASAIVLIGGLGVVVGILTAVVEAFIDGMPQLYGNVQEGVREISAWLRTGPLDLSQRQLDAALERANEWLAENQSTFTRGAGAVAVTAGHVLAGMFLVLFSLFFFLRDGRGIWNFVTSLFPRDARQAVYGAGNAAWRTLTSYVRATVLVAFIDAVGIGFAAYLLDIELWFPIAALVFLASFVPIVGATISGAVAALVALVTHGWFDALLMLGAVIVVQQVEGHLLQPLLLGRAVSLHPLAVIIAIATGAYVAGIVGALIAVPLIAVLNTTVRHLHSARRIEAAGEPGATLREPAPG